MASITTSMFLPERSLSLLSVAEVSFQLAWASADLLLCR